MSNTHIENCILLILFPQLKNGEKGRGKIWSFLKDLEVDMKDWFNGVDVEVPDIIKGAGYQVWGLIMIFETYVLKG